VRSPTATLVLLTLASWACDDAPGAVGDALIPPDVTAADTATGPPDAAPPTPDAAPLPPDAAPPPPDARPPDETPPAVRFLAPADAEEVSGVVALSLEVTDALGVARVELTLGDAAPIPVEAPYAHDWDTAMLRPGPYEIAARAWDDAGNEGVARITVALSVNCAADGACPAPPTVELGVPAWLSAPAEVEAPTDAPSVDFLLDDALASADEEAPFRFLIAADVLEEGPHTLEARVTDGWGQRATAAAGFSVDRTPPVLSFVAPEAEAVVSGPTTIELDATDAQSLEAVTLYVDDVLLGPVLDGAIEWVPEFVGGPRTLRAMARDAAGLETRVERVVEVDHPLTVLLRRCAAGECVAFVEDVPELADGVRFEVEIDDDDPPPQVVVLLVDDERHRFAAPPYVLDVDTAALPDGPHTFVASVAGHRGIVEARRAFTVNNCDRDHDGHVGCGGPDCADGDPEIHPDADDAEADGVDWNCDGHDGPIPDMAIPDAGPDAAVEDPGTGLPRQNEHGPVARIVHLEVPSSAEAARAAGCTVVGTNAGSTIHDWLNRVGQADLDAHIRPDEDGDSAVVMLTQTPDWPVFAEVDALGAVTIRSLGASRAGGRTLIAPAQGDFADTPIDAEGRFRTEPGGFVLPFPLSAELVLSVRLEQAVLSGQLSVDAPGIAVADGRVEGYWTEEAIIEWVAQLLDACAQPGAPANLCNILRFALPPGSPPADGIPVLRQFLGGFDVNWNDGDPQPCEANCDSISVCFVLEGEGAVAHAREEAPGDACDAACDRVADCAVVGACPPRGPRDWVTSRQDCATACDEDVAAAVEAADDCAGRIAALPELCAGP